MWHSLTYHFLFEVFLRPLMLSITPIVVSTNLGFSIGIGTVQVKNGSFMSSQLKVIEYQNTYKQTSRLGKPEESHTNQDELLITNNAFCIVQKARAQSRTGIFLVYDLVEAPSGFQAGWSDCMFFFSFFVRFICSSGISV
jgi:hypothetical protein